jgi:hypothetical protein
VRIHNFIGGWNSNPLEVHLCSTIRRNFLGQLFILIFLTQPKSIYKTCLPFQPRYYKEVVRRPSLFIFLLSGSSFQRRRLLPATKANLQPILRWERGQNLQEMQSPFIKTTIWPAALHFSATYSIQIIQSRSEIRKCQVVQTKNPKTETKNERTHRRITAVSPGRNCAPK